MEWYCVAGGGLAGGIATVASGLIATASGLTITPIPGNGKAARAGAAVGGPPAPTSSVFGSSSASRSCFGGTFNARLGPGAGAGAAVASGSGTWGSRFGVAPGWELSRRPAIPNAVNALFLGGMVEKVCVPQEGLYVTRAQ